MRENYLGSLAAFSTVLILSFVSAAKSAETVVDKPLIGINTDINGDQPEYASVEKHYLDAIRNVGGIPVLLPPMPADDLAEVLGKLDGIMMIGGADYPPSLYKETPHSSVSLMKKSRSDFDIELVKAVLKEGKIPFLGICAGCQALNIASGGSLIQDIPTHKPESSIKHASPEGWKVGFNKHEVAIDKQSKLSSILGKTEMSVVTSHHQCINSAGSDLKVVAHSSDGLVEAIEKKDGSFAIGLQWHPERDFESNRKIFEELVKQAAIRHAALKTN